MNRNIFSYLVPDAATDGFKTVKADPFMLEMAYRKACEDVDINAIMNKFIGPDWLGNEDSDFKPTDEMIDLALKRRNEAHLELIPIICKTFKVRTIEEDQDSGMTADELVTLFGDFQLFTSDIKKNIDSTASSPQPTDPVSRPTPATRNDSAGTTTESLPTESRPSP